jgi:hypothetical protein
MPIPHFSWYILTVPLLLAGLTHLPSLMIDVGNYIAKVTRIGLSVSLIFIYILSVGKHK